MKIENSGPYNEKLYPTNARYCSRLFPPTTGILYI